MLHLLLFLDTFNIGDVPASLANHISMKNKINHFPQHYILDYNSHSRYDYIIFKYQHLIFLYIPLGPMFLKSVISDWSSDGYLYVTFICIKQTVAIRSLVYIPTSLFSFLWCYLSNTR